MKIKKLQDMNWNNPIIDYFREKSNIEKFYIRDSKHAEKSAKHYLKIRKKDQPLSEYGKDVVTAIVHALWA